MLFVGRLRRAPSDRPSAPPAPIWTAEKHGGCMYIHIYIYIYIYTNSRKARQAERPRPHLGGRKAKRRMFGVPRRDVAGSDIYLCIYRSIYIYIYIYIYVFVCLLIVQCNIIRYDATQCNVT